MADGYDGGGGGSREVVHAASVPPGAETALRQSVADRDLALVERDVAAVVPADPLERGRVGVGVAPRCVVVAAAAAVAGRDVVVLRHALPGARVRGGAVTQRARGERRRREVVVALDHDQLALGSIGDDRSVDGGLHVGVPSLAYGLQPRCPGMSSRRPSYAAPVTRYVIDAPTLLHLVAEGVEVDPAHQLVAPNLIRSQALTLLLAAVGVGEISEEVALQRHERLTELKMRLLGDRVSRRTAWKIARAQGWDTTFDAEYLAVTTLQADALVTIDPAMAARAADIVPLAPVEALAAP